MGSDSRISEREARERGQRRRGREPRVAGCPGSHRLRQRVDIDGAMNTHDPADAVERETERKLVRRRERDAEDGQEGRRPVGETLEHRRGIAATTPMGTCSKPANPASPVARFVVRPGSCASASTCSGRLIRNIS